MRAILCIVETDKIIKIGERCYATYGPEIKLSNHLCVDDVVRVCNPMVVENIYKFKTIRIKKKVCFLQHEKQYSENRKQR